MSRVRVLVGHEERRIHSGGRRQARQLGRQRAVLRRLGDLSHEGIAGRSRPHLCVADQWLVRADHPALQRRRQNLGDARRRSGEIAARLADGREQQVRLRHFARDAASRSPRISGTTARSIRGSSSASGIWSRRSPIPTPSIAGVEDAALFRSTDGAASWQELSGLRGHGTGPKWQPGAGGMCLHTIILDPSDPDRMYIAISAAGAFRTDDGGTTWKPINRGLRSHFMPDQDAEVGHCVHHIAMHPSRPGRAVHAEALGRDAQRRRRRQLAEVSGNLADRFRLRHRRARARAGDDLRRAHQERRRALSARRQAAVYRSRSGGNEWEPLTKGLPQANCYVNVLRDAMAVDQLDSCGVYFGTTGGQVYLSPDGGR